MENKDRDLTYENVIQLDDAKTASRNFIANVFMWMFLALGISAFFAYLFANDLSLMRLLINTETSGLSALGMVVVFSPLAFVMIMNFGFNRISFPVLVALFIAYSSLMGISLSFIFLAYTAGSIAALFLVAALVFGVMAVAGYITHQDLTSFGSLMMMGLVGIILASVVNMFIHSAQLDMIISYVGVAVFVGLTAYKVQMLKQIGSGLEYGDATGKKLALIGAMSLYITFINLFLSLLRIFGRRR
ncbi:Bax inhibitor-1/YccA family protein [Mucilaginibacter sp. RS28]|uniref:Bax inhibitor-1/YccA family protein n=1 Tax=Mucilaginibacter straminoryzae TaxID=2932774 RepID=A0A9X1X7F7_9SPHI|nr:Bax inhibitor-1/YccA family protein [Mucilaginibacter straminoryzae]MCJ8211941.1 Bax inhibitor-1/YccA family protein [Mucilaginibacter straminoryzae]